MANNIQTIIASSTGSWSNSIRIPQYPSGSLEFLVVGGKFENNLDKITATTDQFGMYNFTVTADAPKNQFETNHVTVYFDYAGQWTLIQEASRNISTPVSKTVSPKNLLSGFDALNHSDVIDPEFGEAVIAFGAAALTPASLDALVPKALSAVTLNESAFDYKQPLWFVADKAANKVHLFNNPDSAANLIRLRTISGVFVDAIAYYSPATHRRTIAIFSPEGVVSRYDVRMEKQTDVVLPYGVVRVQLLKAAGAFDPLFAVFDTDGKIHKLDSNFSELSVKDDDFYVSCHASLDAYITRSGKLVGTDVWNSIPSAFYYSFAPETEDVYSVVLNSGKLNRINIKSGALTDIGTQDENLLRYPTTFTNPTATLLLAAGSDTTGRKSFVDRAAQLTDVSSRYWSYLSLMSNGATTQLYGFVARPTTKLAHTLIPTYGAVLPTYNQKLGATVTFTFEAEFDDPDDVLPISLPPGVVWTATVNEKQVKSVRNGDSVSVTASHAFITSEPFPFSVGRSNGLVEIVPDPLPDPFTYETIYDVPDYSWQTTVEKTITGVNQRVPLSVLIDGTTQDDRVEYYVNGVLVAPPVFLHENDTFYFRIHHGFNITLITVIAGEYQTDWGIYTVSEIQFDPVPNRAYAEVGKEYRTIILTNDGISALGLTIDSDEGTFIQGGKTVTLEIGQSTQILLTPTEANKKYKVEFGSSRYKYSWEVWTHETWLDLQPADELSNGMILAESDALAFLEIPDNFITDIYVPAGVLFEIDGVPVDGELDSRGVYSNSISIADVSCDAQLKIESYPAHGRPYSIRLGNAEILWVHDFAGEVTYSAKFDSQETEEDQKFISALMGRVDFIVLTLRAYLKTIPELFSLNFGMNKDTSVNNFSLVPEMWKRFVTLPFNLPSLFFASDSVAVNTNGLLFSNAFDSLIGGQYLKDMESGKETAIESFSGEFFDGKETSLDVFSNNFFDEKETVIVIKAPPVPRSVEWNKINPEDAALPSVFESRSPSENENTYGYVTSSGAVKVDAAKAFYTSFPDIGSVYAFDPGYVKLPTIGIVETAFPFWFVEIAPRQFNALESEHRPTYGDNDFYAFEPNWEDKVIQPSSQYQTDHMHYPFNLYQHDAAVSEQVDFNQPNAYFERPVPRWFDLKAYYSIPTEHHFIFAPLTYKYLTSPEYQHSNKPSQLDMYPETYIPGSVVGIPSVYQRMAPENPVRIPTEFVPVMFTRNQGDANDYKLITEQVLRYGDYAPRAIEHAAYPVERMQITMYVPIVDYGNPDPLKKGYFATELEALQNATQVWGKSSEEVYGIQQLDGTWTWAIDIPCGEYCGEFGCDTRGYLAGG